MVNEDYEQVAKSSKKYMKDIINLSEREVEKIERVCDALKRQFDAEASKEAHQKFRILFQRASKEHLPFIIYVIYMGAVGIAAFVNIDKVPVDYSIWYLATIIIVMLGPMLLLWSKFVYKNKE